MSGFKTGSISFTLLLKLCEAPAPSPGEAPGTPNHFDAGASYADAGSGSDAGAGQGVDGGAAQDAGGDASDAASDASVSEVLSGPPGLYRDDACEKLAEGVRPYAPRFALWADGADKERFVVLPEGATIDATNADLWTFPVGTRFYKTFAIDGLKLETRIMEKTASGHGPDAWRFRAYAWLADQSGVELVEATGRTDVLGTTHDIPSVAQCRSCHSAAGQDVVNGFSAIQLNYPHAGVTLKELLAEGALVSPIGDTLPELAVVPGDKSAQRALGYLHANCGNCHGGATPRASMTLRLSVGQLELETSAPYLSVVGQPLRVWTGHSQPSGFPFELRVAAGAPAASGIFARMSARGSRDQMPPIGTEQVDPDGLALISGWIESL